ncbi:hypothetical protein LguiA_006081 [Lonicera macranthoides]
MSKSLRTMHDYALQSLKEIANGHVDNLVMASSSHSINSQLSCYCGSPSVTKISRTKKNPGRIFIGCPNYKDQPCKFFKWANQLNDTTEEELKNEHMKNKDLIKMIEDEHKQNRELRMKHNELEKKYKKLEFKVKMLMVLIVCLVIVMLCK